MDLTTQGKNGQQKLLLDSQLTEVIFESNDARPGPTMVLYSIMTINIQMFYLQNYGIIV